MISTRTKLAGRAVMLRLNLILASGILISCIMPLEISRTEYLLARTLTVGRHVLSQHLRARVIARDVIHIGIAVPLLLRRFADRRAIAARRRSRKEHRIC